MTKWILGLLVVVVACNPAYAAAHSVLVEPMGSPYPLQQWVDEAELPSPTQTIPVFYASDPCNVPDAGGCTEMPPEPDTDESPAIHLATPMRAAETHFTLLHEIANTINVPSWMQERFLALIGKELWATDTGLANYNFGDAYAACAWPSHFSSVEIRLFHMSASLPSVCRLLRRLPG